ncbi:FMN-binding negative transcriptional regulator [Altererythrobacter sp. RZ02]|uniref:FMN-binding negative transcriptional regulator n=1 Tax=Pontixanthobacter rizhaonensis TaxID=2730337 RepID=A0A848QIU6_9SPHN|nr:FMN-binding negative transcriptional regulator [Pontixanthobacter rizhaonensis]NMW30720.1 FMN-binding negative transcriptional regulator [Pontixanthobacter rizhaonensis]
MHPNPSYRSDDRALMETLLDEIGFGTVFLTTPDGPRVAHTPLVSTGDGAVQFHIARANALARHLDGATALAVINGPDAYVSPRWYSNRKTVPTWDYISLELEGRVRHMDDDGLEALLHTLIERGETRLGGDQWNAQETPADIWAKLFGAIRGFELEILAWRPTLKLHQGTTAEDRANIASGLENSGSPALAQLMRTLAP